MPVCVKPWLTTPSSLLHSALTLECYRATFFQLPPRMSSRLSRTLLENSGLGTTCLWQLSAVLSKRQQLRGGVDRILLALSALITPRFIPNNEEPESENELWRTDFAHLALNNLGVTADLPLSDVLLYHMVNISLHISLNTLQCLARCKVGDATDTTKALLTRHVKRLHSTRYGEIARWHATRIVLKAQNHFSGQTKATAAVPSHSSSKERSSHLALGAPHVPYSIYYATLVLWSAAAVNDNSQMERELLLRTGSHVLSSLTLRVARVLAGALLEVERSWGT